MLALAGAVNGFLPRGDCGSGFLPHSGALEHYDTVTCVAARADGLETALLLLGVGIVAMVAGQITGWRGKPGADGS